MQYPIAFLNVYITCLYIIYTELCSVVSVRQNPDRNKFLTKTLKKNSWNFKKLYYYNNNYEIIN